MNGERTETTQVGILPTPVDWFELFDSDSKHNWLVHGFWPVGRQLQLHAPRKSGKSLFMLYVAASLAAGRDPFTGETVLPRRVVYLDYEMTEEDVRERLKQMRFAPNDLHNLKYYLLPSLKPFDTAQGGKQLIDLLLRDAAEVLVIDTLARVVQGGENDNDTYRHLYQHTGVQLKRHGISMARLDHEGHGGNHSRGASSKSDDVDIVWQLGTERNRLQIRRKATRINWVPDSIDLERTTEPLRFSAKQLDHGERIEEKIRELNELGLPLDATRQDATKAFANAGRRPGRTELLQAALTSRRSRAGLE